MDERKSLSYERNHDHCRGYHQAKKIRAIRLYLSFGIFAHSLAEDGEAGKILFWTYWLKKIPDAVFIIDGKEEHIALTESRGGGVPVVSLVNSDSNIKGIDYPIVGNDSGMPSIKFFTSCIADAYKEGQMSVIK